MKHYFIIFLSLCIPLLTLSQNKYSIPIEKEEEEKEDIIIGYIETMPYLASCQDSISSRFSSDKLLLGYIYNSIRYPSGAVCIEGTVVISFVINKEGWIDSSTIKILRDPGGGLGKEGVRLVQNINKKLGKFIPATQRGKSVDIRYNLPIRFKL